MNNYTEIKENFLKMKEEFRKNAQNIFKNEFKKIFDETVIKSIRWTQYTPYFNDGDECIFSVNTVFFATTDNTDNIDWDFDEDNDDLECNVYSEYTLHEDNCKLNQYEISLLHNLLTFMEDSDIADVLKDMFGDHAEIIATANGFNVNEYDHD